MTGTAPQSGWSRQAPLVHPCLQQGQLDLVAQDHIQVDFEYLQGQRQYSLSRQSVLVPGQLHSHNTIFIFVSVLGTLPPVRSLCNTEKILAHSSHFPIGVNIHWKDPPELGPAHLCPIYTSSDQPFFDALPSTKSHFCSETIVSIFLN